MKALLVSELLFFEKKSHNCLTFYQLFAFHFVSALCISITELIKAANGRKTNEEALSSAAPQAASTTPS